ncbi:MAG: chromosomal replication initiator protein DnaA [Patescibacteria group bacterium]
MEQKSEEKIWEKTLGEIESFVSKANFTTWFQNTSINKKKDGVIFLNVPNSFTREWIRSKYNKFIIGILRKIDPSIRAIEYVIHSKPTGETGKDFLKYRTQEQGTDSTPQLKFNEINTPKDSLNPRYTFDNFVVGSFNELAHAAATAVSKEPGSLYNPLFIYGGVGLGKTHLLQAIGNKIKENNPNIKAKYTTSEKFSNDLVQSIQNNKTFDFKNNYKRYDVLIMDDVQFFAGKTKTREEFFHIFNTLHESNKQIVFSSDRPPKSIPDLEARLRSRFEGGMMTDITEPEYESRIAILKTKMSLKNIDLSSEVVDYIASMVKNNIRELEGALNLLSVQTKLLGKSLSVSETKEIFNKNIIYSRKKITFEKIIQIVAEFYNIKEQCLFEKSRRKEYVLPRQVAMYLLREDFNGSYPYIGRKFDGRDHTTVIHAYEKINQDIKRDPQLKNDVDRIRGCLYE